MTRINQIKSLAGDLRTRAGAAWAKLSGRPAPASAYTPAPSFAPPDPTKVLFPDMEGPADDGGRGLALSVLLEESARAMVRRTDELREQKKSLIARMGDRADAEITLSVQALRVMIGLIWLAAAAWLYYNGLRGDAAALSIGMPAADAFVLSRTFFTIAATGLGVAFGIVALVNLFGNGDNRKVRGEAEQLGIAIADTSREFDEALTGFRTAMDRRDNPADAVIDLSRAHLTALEACAYFRHIGFLTGGGEHAMRLFRGFLSGRRENPAPLPVFAVGAIFGGFFGAAYIYAKYVPKSVPTEPIVPPAIAQYPEALSLILIGGVLYVSVGLLLSIFGGFIAAGAAAKAREEALDALRGGFTAREAPRPADVVRRIEDAVDVFRARVGGKGAGASRREHRANQFEDNNASYSVDDADIFPWRHPDSSIKFIDAGFTTAPKEWRTDAFAKKFTAGEDRKPGSKRGRLSFKKPSGD